MLLTVVLVDSEDSESAASFAEDKEVVVSAFFDAAVGGTDLRRFTGFVVVNADDSVALSPTDVLSPFVDGAVDVAGEVARKNSSTEDRASEAFGFSGTLATAPLRFSFVDEEVSKYGLDEYRYT